MTHVPQFDDLEIEADARRADLMVEMVNAVVHAALHPLTQSAVLRHASDLLEAAWAEYAPQELRAALARVMEEPEIRFDRQRRLYFGNPSLAAVSAWTTQAGSAAEAIADFEIPRKYRPGSR